MARLKRVQRDATSLCMIGKEMPELPVVVTITRIGPRMLDDDNLAGACKYVRDAISYRIAVDDASPLYTWRYAQRAGEYGVDVEIVPRMETTS